MRSVIAHPLLFALIAVPFFVLIQPAAAQNEPPPVTDVPHIELPEPPAQEKRGRLYGEEFLAVGMSVDLNPRDKNLIVYPHFAIVYVVPEIGINVRTAGSRYVAFGISGIVFFPSPVVRLSYGQQWRNSFVEVGVLGFPTTYNDGWEWTEPHILPRLSLGVRF